MRHRDRKNNFILEKPPEEILYVYKQNFLANRIISNQRRKLNERLSEKYQDEYRKKLITAEEAVKLVKSGDWCSSANRDAAQGM